MPVFRRLVPAGKKSRMALDAYSPCPCGSGKKFKWCCQPIHVEINKAFAQDAEGQHEAALRALSDVVAQNPANPEAWGRKAQLLYENGRLEEAENALQKALEINPNYPFGHLLRGMFRQNEGETSGALLLFRKAAELYDPEARDVLGQVYALIAESEFKSSRPVAARAAFKMAARFQPANEELRKGFENLFGDQSRLPPAARREYTFQSLPASAGEARRQAWDRALASAATGKLTDAAAAFEQVTQDDSENAAAWYNLGLVRAWLGDNHRAIEALDQYVAREPDEKRAGAAWTLAEVLRCGHGMEEEANYLEHALMYQIRDGASLSSVLREWEGTNRLVGMQVSQEQGYLTGLVLEQGPALTPSLAAAHAPGIGAYLMVVADRLRLWNTDAKALERVRDEVRQRLGASLSQPRAVVVPAGFGEVLSECLVFPVRIPDNEEARRRVQAHVQQFFEETWIHRPLRSLNLIPPIDAAGHPTLRRKLIGAVQFLQDCAQPAPAFEYNFDRLRRKLGLLADGQGSPAVAPDIGAMSAAELSALTPENLSDEDLEAAYQSALKLDARELAARFAHGLIARPPRADRGDRYPWYAHLVQMALAEGDSAAALDQLNHGEKSDCEHNEGRRRNDYELRRAQIHAKRGETAEAQGVFERLIERAPSELRFRGSAAEAMLSARQPAQALRFAEEGLVKAREQNNRDSEGYFLELVAAAKKQKGS
jgi:tetratricopeptide (TPR) repeat protein